MDEERTAEQENEDNLKPCPYNKNIDCVQYESDDCDPCACDDCEIKIALGIVSKEN